MRVAGVLEMAANRAIVVSGISLARKAKTYIDIMMLPHGDFLACGKANRCLEGSQIEPNPNWH